MRPPVGVFTLEDICDCVQKRWFVEFLKKLNSEHLACIHGLIVCLHICDGLVESDIEIFDQFALGSVDGLVLLNNCRDIHKVLFHRAVAVVEALPEVDAIHLLNLSRCYMFPLEGVGQAEVDGRE